MATSDFVEDIRSSADVSTEQAAQAATAVLCTLGQRISGGQALDVLERLPESARQLAASCDIHREHPAQRFDRAEFVRRVEQHLSWRPHDSERVIRAVLDAVRTRLSSTEVRDVESELPADILALWRMPSGAERSRILMEDLGTIGTRKPVPVQRAAEAVLCTLEQRLSGGEAKKLSAELPESVRELIRRCEPHREAPAAAFGRAEFLQRVADHLGVSVSEAELITRAVFEAVRRQVSIQEAKYVERQLPDELAEMWRYPRPEQYAEAEERPAPA